MRAEVVHLRYIVAAGEHRSFRRAAAALNITQPTFSKRIRELEDRLGVSLFERSASGARLTSNGREFFTSAKRVLAELSLMEDRLRAGIVGNRGQLGIGFYTSLSTGALREVLRSFANSHPDVEIDLNASSRSDIVSLLDRGAIDVAIVLGERTRQDCAYMPLWSDRVMVALPTDHPLADREFVYWTDLKEERFLISVRDSGPELGDILLSKLAAPGDRPHIKAINAGREDVLNMVGGGHGIALICESTTGTIFNGVSYCEVRDGNGPTRVGLLACWRHNNENPALRKFLTSLQTNPAVPSRNRRY